MSTIDNRCFIVYADYLGTKHRYATPDLVVRGRELLEQALERIVVPKLKTDDMYLYVFSDTAIMTCPRLEPLLEPLANLFSYFVDLRGDGQSDEMTLWLRAAISHGTNLKVEHLQTSDRIRTIPLIDTSLPTAYELESIRKGSRVFVDPSILDESFLSVENFFLKWKQITGRGHYVSSIREFLWPALHYKESGRLKQVTLKLNNWWSKELNKQKWSKDDYYKGIMIHLDETLKLFIRTCSVFCCEEDIRLALFSLLPANDVQAVRVNIQYEWGVWFQALRGIVENCDLNYSTAEQFESAFINVKTILTNNRYYEHFIGELDYPDYALFKSRLCSMSLIDCH